MSKTTLVIMAAGIGSRFGGGIKQLTAFGPNGEIIMDFSIYDAIEAGFNKVVFVIRKSLEKDFKEIIGDRIAKQIEVDYAFQEIENVPEGCAVPEGRVKPWGTGQAILACKGIVNEPFAVINADDYYGKEAFRLVHDYLIQMPETEKGCFYPCMAGFILKNTLSEHGGVTRGICHTDEAGVLIGIDETRGIMKTEEGAAVENEDGSLRTLNAEGLVSMNMWGFSTDFIEELESGFKSFLMNLPGDGTKGEYLLPTIVDCLIKENRADVSVLKSHDHWFGVTFKEDVPVVIEEFRKLFASGVYPEKLWKD